ncbi:hypothetical protein WA026_011425 [Henosepilachna vigintioctopunctata]|uniref:C2H2-type domain-containing protein n=1 Tax=Henosepilachna vigintioctopunctata TaxID=420089 RepID=A0AAW1TRR3_9CUCU
MSNSKTVTQNEEVDSNQISGVKITKKMEYLNSLKLVGKDFKPLMSNPKPKIVTRLLRNRVVLKEVDIEKKINKHVPAVTKEITPDAIRDRDVAEQKILFLALANNIPMDGLMKKVIALSPVVKIERRPLFPNHSSKISSHRISEPTEISTNEDLLNERGKSLDRENSFEKKPFVDMQTKEKLTPLESGTAEEIKTILLNSEQISESGTIHLIEEELHPDIKIKESSPYIELSIEKSQYNERTEVELREGTTDIVEEVGESKICITEDVLSVESQTERNYCDFCNIGYTSDTLLEKHKKNCKMNPLNKKTFPGKIFYCRYCYFGITNENYFKLHESRCNNEQKNNSKSKKRFKRTSCKEPNDTKTKRPKMDINKCPHCDYSTKYLGHLNEHVRIHSKVPLCICEICDKGFNRMSSLRMHMFKHLNLAEEISLVESKEICEENAKKITMQVKLNGRNIEIVKYECNNCEFVTTVLFSLEMHINTMHLKKQEFKCNVCPFTSFIKSNLRQHLNIHTKERIYKCKKCPYECLNATYLKKHDNQVHTKEKVFKCSSCDFKCYRQENLKCHINSMHSKKKRYDCKFCKYFSYYQSNLINHVKAIHIGY